MNLCWGLLWTVPLGKGKELMLPTNVLSQVECPKCPWATRTNMRAALEKGEELVRLKERVRKSPAKTLHSTRHLLRDFSTDSTRFCSVLCCCGCIPHALQKVCPDAFRRATHLLLVCCPCTAATLLLHVNLSSPRMLYTGGGKGWHTEVWPWGIWIQFR